MDDKFSIDAHETITGTGPTTFFTLGAVTDPVTGAGHRRISADLSVGDTTIVLIKQSAALLEVVRLQLVAKGAQDQWTLVDVLFSTTGSAITFTDQAVKDIYPAFTTELIPLTTTENLWHADQIVESDAAGLDPNPTLWLRRWDPAPAAGAHMGRVAWLGRNTGGAQYTGAYMVAVAADPTAGSEDTYVAIYVTSGGALPAVSARFHGGLIELLRPTDLGGQQLRLNTDGAYFLGFSTGQLDYFAGGTRRLRLTSAGNLVVGDTLAPSGHKLQISSATDAVGSLFENTHASFAGRILTVRSTRAASNTFDLMRLEASGGTDRKFQFVGDGNAFADGTFTSSSPGDFAELMLWEDGNEAGEDRDGLTVVAVGIDPRSRRPIVRLSRPDDDPAVIEGVVSAKPTTIGGESALRWHAKWKTDALGRDLEGQLNPEWDWERISPYMLDPETGDVLTEEVEVAEDAPPAAPPPPVAASPPMPPPPGGDAGPPRGGNDNRGRTPGAMARAAAARPARRIERRPVPNPKYDPDYVYIPRSQRREWAKVAVMGFVPIWDGQVTHPNWRRYPEEQPVEGVGLWKIR
jgi:Peptidase_G2, IMC autoproteolytic cleavage domain